MRIVELCERLREATDGGRIEWQSEDDTSFVWGGGSAVITLRSQDRDGEHPFELVVHSPEMLKVESLTSEWSADEHPAPWNDTLAALYRSARRQALGLDRILDDLFAELAPAQAAQQKS